jgi:hypothetical protein
MFQWIFAQAADAPTAAAELAGLPKGWEKLLDLGVTGFIICLLFWVAARFVIPRIVSQHENLVGDLLKAFREESNKAREYHERLVSTHEQMFRDERSHHEALVKMIVEEWRVTREQLHRDATMMHGVLRKLAAADSEPEEGK